MNILLLQQFLGRKEKLAFPLGLAYLAASLKKHDVKVLDCNLHEKDHDKVIFEHMERYQPDLIGVSLRNIDTSLAYDRFSYLKQFYSDIKAIRNKDKRVKIVVGGSGFSLFPDEVMERGEGIDYGVSGEAEETLPELIERIDDPRSVKGVYFKEKEGKIIFTGIRTPADFDSLGPLGWGAFDISRYKQRKYQIGILTKRGCGLECVYCVYPHLTGNSIRLRSPAKVAEDIESLTRLGVKDLFFCDSVFNAPQGHAEAVCKEIISRHLKIEWTAFFNEKFITREFADLSIEAGCRLFQFSPDGATDKALGNLNKIQTISDMEKAYGLLAAKAPVRGKVYLFLNAPQEGIRYFWELTGFLLRNLLGRKNFSFRLHTMRIYPYTKLYQTALSARIIKKGQRLVEPVFYDPLPLKLISKLVNMVNWTALNIARSLAIDRQT